MSIAVDYLVLAVVAGLAAIERKGFLQAMLSRPVALAPLTGLALGDLDGGLLLGPPLGLLWLGAVNLGAILAHYTIAQDPSRRCTVSTPTNCSNPPIPDSDRALLQNIDVVKYVSAGLFWAVYAYGVADALIHYVPRIETEVTPTQAAVKLSWSF